MTSKNYGPYRDCIARGAGSLPASLQKAESSYSPHCETGRLFTQPYSTLDSPTNLIFINAIKLLSRFSQPICITSFTKFFVQKKVNLIGFGFKSGRYHLLDELIFVRFEE